ncbi:tail fiber domain-containing protein [Flavilitoribacter nigricans]|uniref:Peptidase S74 domain-containing protein n=1 Tax=Flavilitoribacter nigricans (strain ATCC 23147 / DSM 23189 / NBRC 102662 / NCIMB 1420 / SS-2) TaxID=1122177 RepID=A0A2D0NAT7_FLAN2|nr:tail fiber domain-containing protein [Flavilitoribacter nigricans]PHN05480.1 hypothetical protein CRP01_15915 [Flavilitoribacter nigricans DSM 23189 = NBRC 102662]
MKALFSCVFSLCIVISGASAQVQTKLLPGGLNIVDVTSTTLAGLNWEGQHFYLRNQAGKDSDLHLQSNGAMIFSTSGAKERMRILADGRIGIGIADASAQVGIYSNSTANSSQLLLTEATAEDFARLRFNNSNSAGFWQLGARSDVNPEVNFSFSDGQAETSILSLNGTNGTARIGPAAQFSPNAKLLVYNEDGGDQNNLGTNYDIYTRPAPSIWTRYGIYSYVSGAAEGVDITTQGQKIGLAVSARSSGSTKTAVSAYAGIGTGTNYGVHSTVNGIGGAESYAIYAQASGGNSTTSPPVWAGYFAGDVFSSGSYLPSDQKLKSGIRKADSSLDRLRQLQVSTYRYQSKYQQKMGLDQRSQTGFLAHEVEEVFPELTREVAQPLASPEEIAAGQEEAFLKFTGVNYVGFIPHLTLAIQEQQQQISEQEEQIKTQQEQIEEIQATNKLLLERLAQLETRLASTDAPASDPTSIHTLTSAELAQNAPNPFSQTTRIAYFVPEQVQRARMEILDAGGRLLKEIAIDNRGHGQVELQGQTLSAGQYTYRLILDGQVSASRQMVLTR